MRLRLKDLLVMLNTASLAAIIVYLKYPDLNAAMICGLAIFIICMLIYLFLKFSWKRRQRDY
ncbi:hypothetical protein LZZ85_07825 [Terrimonas sp. NA20]|uniref:Uncharacterized protein n=1 Tax=Terrimonas ginsenosidimutans TaxID=2908004 RepID=A0ABS9KPG0_9BACT|nr:hypothetical protein [Terrimonas ginsenosidimutans]MCG2614185.1 hypothetical protein [Terrimonas ginsenosidimutans]